MLFFSFPYLLSAKGMYRYLSDSAGKLIIMIIIAQHLLADQSASGAL